MPKICYVPGKFEPKSLALIAKANAIIDTLAAQGFILTLRQLYYRLVATGVIPNNQQSYDRLQELVAKARLAGHIDWEMIEDRTRNLMGIGHYTSAQDALEQLAKGYFTDLWANQKYRPEVWVEKDALVGIVARYCNEHDVPYFSCRGYVSLSEMWGAAMRFKSYMQNDQLPYIIHLGDHDPSGIDMSRDIYDRINNTFLSDCKFNRVALTMDQVEKYQPPPNPAKVTDSRYEAYVSQFGDESWELDALEPSVFQSLIEGELKKLRDEKIWKKDIAEREATRKQLIEVKDEWETIPQLKHNNAKLTNDVSILKEQEHRLRDEIAKLKKRKKKS